MQTGQWADVLWVWSTKRNHKSRSNLVVALAGALAIHCPATLCEVKAKGPAIPPLMTPSKIAQLLLSIASF
jgi:hypothetical protein